jgi:hypothetical protein
MMRTLIFCTGLTLISSPLVAQSPRSENTLALDPSSPPGKATLEDVRWLAGHWRGEGLGGISDEIWSEPAAGTMVGTYRLVKDGEVSFYELMVLQEREGSLVLRLKHFTKDMVAWEEKEKTVDFRLVRTGEREAYFHGLTFRSPTPEELEIFLVLTSDGKSREERFRLRRVMGPTS